MNPLLGSLSAKFEKESLSISGSQSLLGNSRSVCCESNLAFRRSKEVRGMRAPEFFFFLGGGLCFDVVFLKLPKVRQFNKCVTFLMILFLWQLASTHLMNIWQRESMGEHASSLAMSYALHSCCAMLLSFVAPTRVTLLSCQALNASWPNHQRNNATPQDQGQPYLTAICIRCGATLYGSCDRYKYLQRL